MPGRLCVVRVDVIDTHRETQLKHAIILKFRLAALDSALDDNSGFAELCVVFGLDQLEQNVDFRLVLLERRSEIVPDDGLLAGLELSVDVLLDAFVLFVLDEGLEWPGHVRLILHSELKCDFATLNDFDIHEII